MHNLSILYSACNISFGACRGSACPGAVSGCLPGLRLPWCRLRLQLVRRCRSAGAPGPPIRRACWRPARRSTRRSQAARFSGSARGVLYSPGDFSGGDSRILTIFQIFRGNAPGDFSGRKICVLIPYFFLEKQKINYPENPES